jgi:mannose-6-phosphate isomerase-like protein (cupin superfamily)
VSDNQTVTTYVHQPEDIVWHQANVGRDLALSDELAGSDYSSAFNAQLSKFGPGGGSPPHDHPYNHAFYFLSGSASVQIGEQAFRTKPGTFVKVPARHQHSVTNTGTEDLIFLVIYDPPNVDITT